MLSLDLRPLLLRQVRDLPGVDLDGALDGRFVLVGLCLWRSYFLQLFALFGHKLHIRLVLGGLARSALAAHELLPDFVRLFQSVHKL